MILHNVELLIDFGVEHLVSLTESTKFPWLMSNVVDKLTNRPLGEGLVKRIITWEGRKVRNYMIVTLSYVYLCYSMKSKERINNLEYVL